MVSGVIALALFAFGPQGPEAPQRFQMDITMKQVADLSPMGMGEQSSEVSATAWYTLTMSDTTGGQLAHAVIDSIVITEMVGQGPPGLDSATAATLAGEFVHAYIVDGKVEGSAEPSAQTNPAMSLASPVMGLLFPGIKGDTKTWADTVVSTVTPPAGGEINTQNITDWSVTGNDGAAIMVAGSSAGTVSGSSSGQEISGQVSNTWTVTSVAGGPSSSATLESAQDMIVIIAAAPEPINVMLSTTTVLTQLP